MILTGRRIAEEVAGGGIVLDPFNPNQVNPNSYNYRLGRLVKLSRICADGKIAFDTYTLGQEGILLEKGAFALGVTAEMIGSDRFAMSLIGRSSIGRLGLFLQVSANLGHVQTLHKWTLELYAANAIRIYPDMIIGQVSFWKTRGPIPQPKERYSAYNHPQESLVTTRARSP